MLTYNSSIEDPTTNYEIIINGKNINNVPVDESLKPADTTTHTFSLKTILNYVEHMDGWGQIPTIDV